jgi:hypothetical protein
MRTCHALCISRAALITVCASGSIVLQAPAISSLHRVSIYFLILLHAAFGL